VESISSDAGNFQEFPSELDFLLCLNITILVMAIADMSACDKNSVPPLL
jgi:hypothetical protein